jgi:hypothetical protein
MRSSLLVLVFGATVMGACEAPLVPNLNDPIIDDFRQNPTPAQVQSMATGLLFGSRVDMGPHIRNTEIIGRDAYNLDPADPRWVSQLLGPNLDPGGFGQAHWLVRYRNIKAANILINAVGSAPELSAAQQAATRGFARTIKALDLLYVWETRATLGIAADAAVGVDDLADILCSANALTRIAVLLDSANTELQGTSFPFPLPPGFEGFDTPTAFARFNRGLKAKVEVFRGQYASALTTLGQSFISTSGPLDAGVYHTYSLASGDAQNPLFQDTASTNFRVHRSVVTQAEANDQRVARKVATSSPLSWPTDPAVNSPYIFIVYEGPTSPLPILRNEELILLRAEARYFTGDVAGALQDINAIRTTSGGLLPRGAFVDANDFTTELLKQKRYSLLWESASRWVDARRFNRLNTLPLDNPTGHVVHAVYPIPEDEELARGGDVACQ